jgi:glycine/D-amino acid oxidase-like deaminating enzyme
MRPMADAEFYRSRSLWLDSLDDDDLTPRAALAGDIDVDVAIVGAGYTGLWTAYYLLKRDPALRVAVVEAEIAGFGASGRNGGWCSALLPMSLDTVAAGAGRDAAIALQSAMFDTVDEVGKVAAAEGIDCHYTKGGYLKLATEPAHAERLGTILESYRRYGFGEEHARLLDRHDARALIAADRVRGGVFVSDCAAIHPARLVRGLARVVERAGAKIVEQTRVTAIEPRRLRTHHGDVRAEVVVRATEGYTARLPGLRRTLAPIYSLMIATEPLPASFWDAVGWSGRATFSDARHVIIYGQRTADGRIAFGGRGAPYHFGSKVDPAFDRDERVFALLKRTLAEFFPDIADADITHNWGGPLAAPRDWYCSVGFDRETGSAWAGGYVGDGVATTNLAGRTLADLITKTESDLTRLPWVDHRSRRWEPEPLRWFGINGALRLAPATDNAENRRGKRARVRSWMLNRLIGH